MRIGVHFVDAVYRKESTSKNRIAMTRKPVDGCADFCRKAIAQRHEVIFYYETTRLKVDSSLIRKYLQYHRIPFSRICQAVNRYDRKKNLPILDMVIAPGEISCGGFAVTFAQKDIYRCATDLLGNSMGEWSDEQVDWFNALFEEELRVAMEDDSLQ